MHNALRDRAVRTAGISGLIILAMTLIGGTRLPWAFAIVWVIWAALTTAAVARSHRTA
jgi:hypothetical protein